MDILFLLLSFALREIWRLSEQVFVNCYQNFGSVPPFVIWNKEHGRSKGLSEQMFPSCYQDFVFFAQEIFTVVHPSILKENA